MLQIDDLIEEHIQILVIYCIPEALNPKNS